MTGIYVLIVVLSFGSPGHPVSIVQEFSSLELCEIARKEVAKVPSSWASAMNVRSQGCYKK